MSERLMIRLDAALSAKTVEYAAGTISELLEVETDWSQEAGGNYIYWRRALDCIAMGDISKLEDFLADGKFSPAVVFLNDEIKFFT